MVELLVSFRASTREQVLVAANTLLMVPALSERSMVSAEFFDASRAHAICVRLYFDRERFDDAARSRVTFWLARAGGALRSPGASTILIAVSDGGASSFASAVERMCAATGHEIALSPPLAPLLMVDLGGPATAGIVYDAARRRLFVPCPLAPPAGDSFLVEVLLPQPEPQRVRVFGRVEEVRPPSAASAGRPAGFALALDLHADSAHAALAAALQPDVDDGDHRAAPRVRTAAATAVAAAGAAGAKGAAPQLTPGPACLRDLSHHGAFVRTAAGPPVGTPLRIAIRLPDGADLETTAEVVHAAPDGVGVHFRLDACGGERLAEALTSLAGRSQRVLVVDHDVLARRMLADAFESRGFEVLTAPDADRGIHVLADEILALDALVTDVRTPGVEGEELVRWVRGAGGEHDLPIVAVTPTLDDSLAERLHAAGANRAVERSSGLDLIVDATLAEISSRRAWPGASAAASAA